VPHHLVIDAQDNLYTVSDDDGRVWKVSPEGQLTEFHARRPAAPQVGAWGDPFTLDRNGTIYFVLDGRNRILRFVGDSAQSYADTTFRFSRLHGASMAWGPDSALYVTDVSRVVRIAPDGSVSVVGSPPLAHAMGVAVDSASRIYVADYRAGAVLRIGPGGESRSFGARRFVRPTGVALGPDGSVYVLDGRIWKIQPDGNISLIACATAIPPWIEYGIVLFVPLLFALWIVQGRKSSMRDRILRIVITGIVMTPFYFAARSGCSSLEVRYAVYALLIAAAAWSLTARRRAPATTR
jgi:streptogramin lyase